MIWQTTLNSCSVVLQNSTEILVLGRLPVYPDLSTRHDYPVKNKNNNLKKTKKTKTKKQRPVPIRLKGNLKRISGNSLSLLID